MIISAFALRFSISNGLSVSCAPLDLLSVALSSAVLVEMLFNSISASLRLYPKPVINSPTLLITGFNSKSS